MEDSSWKKENKREIKQQLTLTVVLVDSIFVCKYHRKRCNDESTNIVGSTMLLQCGYNG